MELRALYRDDDAVSSVLGVVLMVAVTIILAAVIGTFVLGIGSELTDASPSTSWEIEPNLDGTGSDNGTVLILHGGGDDVEKSTLEVTVDGKTVFEDGENVSVNYKLNDNWGDPVTSGDRLVIEENNNDLEGTVVRIIWHSGDKSTILADKRLSG
jgi:FlaG/FlaF family flagellin (archaellin)